MYRARHEFVIMILHLVWYLMFPVNSDAKNTVALGQPDEMLLSWSLSFIRTQSFLLAGSKSPTSPVEKDENQKGHNHSFSWQELLGREPFGIKWPEATFVS